MQAANEPSKRNIVVECLETVPSFTGGRHVNESQHDPGNHLQKENYEGGTAENVKPACGFARNRMLHRFADRRAKLETRVQPFANGFNQAHGRISLTILEAWPGVGISPALMSSFPFSILYPYSNNPRSGGPE